MEKYKEITASELKQWRDDDKQFTLIDTLGPTSFAEKHLPGAMMVDAHEPTFLENVGNILSNKDETVVLYCSGPSCPLSPQAAMKLVKEGYKNVYEFSGGLQGWEEAGYLFEK